MSGNEKNLVTTGAGLVWRHQRILWWVFGVNFVLGLMGTMGARAAFSRVLDHSLAAQKISGQVRIISLIDLLAKPDVQMPALAAPSIAFQVVFFVFMLFVAGGILSVYREDRRLAVPEFFEACGLYFWRFFRLMLISLIPFAIATALYLGVGKISEKVGEASPYESHAFWVRAIGGLIVILLWLFVRLWFDVAQVRAVAQNERGMWRNTFRALRISSRAVGMLLWLYFRISLVAWVVLIAGIWLWLRIPGTAFSASWLLLEVVLLIQIAVRLWQRASCIAWYKLYAEEHPAAAVEFTTPKPAEIVDSAPASTAAPAES
ncbi:MAG TPA: hypothetical protein VN622_00895 [Clostridia bacterium]|nr:hypothetical protein [Clostridia bacterium]